MPGSPPAALAPLTASDAERIVTWVSGRAEVVNFAGPRMSFPLTAAALLSGEGGRQVFVFRQDGVAVATGSLRPAGAHAVRIGWVLVDPARRGEGWGRQLMTALLAEAWRDAAVRTVELGVYEHNLTARALYAASGFRDSGRRGHTMVAGEVWTSLELTRAR